MAARTWPLALATGVPLTAVGAPNVALPAIAADLHAGFGAQQWVVAMYALLLAALQFASGPIADRLGRRRTTLLGLLVFCVASAVAALAPSATVLVVARGAQGAGGALTITGALALMAVQTSGADRLRAVALRSGVIAVSFAIGPLLGGLCVDGPGWRWIFGVDALVALPLVALLARAGAREPEPAAALAADADWRGLVLLTGGLLAGVAATIRGGDDGWGSPAIVVLFLVALIGVGAFAWRDRHAAAPLLPRRLVGDPAFQATTLGLAGLYFALFGGMVYLTRFLQVVKGRTALETGLLLVPFAAASLLAVIAVTRRPPRSERGIVTVAFLAGAGGLLTLRGLSPGTSLWALMPGLVLVGLASGVVNPLATAGHLATFAPRDGGIAAGINSSARQLGTAVGTAVLGAIVQHADRGTPASLARGVGDAMLVGAAVLLALAALVAVRGGQRRAPASATNP